ncbi:glycosyltransferase [Patescibacteria group bacterium]
MNTPKRILVLTASAGYGHRSAANSIIDALKEENPNYEIEIFDTWSLLPAWQHWIYTKGYVLAGRLTPDFYRFVYRTIVNSPRHLKSVKNGFLKNARGLNKYTKRFNPDVVVATHAHGAGIAHHLKEHFKHDFKLVYAYTDYHAHNLLRYDAVDLYCLPAESVADELNALGVPRENIAVTGVPVRREFGAYIKQSDARKQLGIDPGRFTVLLMRGGHAIGSSWMSQVLKLAHQKQLAVNIIAVTGTNEILEDRLNRLVSKYSPAAHNTSVQVVGFSKDIPLFLAAADVYVGKPGGLSLSEALTVGRPLIVDSGMPGTEDGNLEFVKREKIGLKAENPRDVINHLRYFSDNKDKLKEYKKRAHRLGQPQAAQNIAKNIDGII